MKRDQMNERDSFFERTEQQVLFYLYENRDHTVSRADADADEISDRCDPSRFKLTPSEREFYMAALDALEKSVGQRVTIRELSNQAGVQYEPFRRLVKRLEHIGYIERFGKLTASFDRDRAMELLRIGS